MMRMDRWIACLVLVCFAGRELAWAGPEPRLRAPGIEIEIPAGLGAVQDRLFNPSSPALVVHIHDAHANYEAQTRIRHLIGHLRKKFGFSLLLLEGSDGVLDPSIYRVFKDPALNFRLAEALVKEGELSGAEMHLIGREDEAAGSVAAYGIEDSRLYREDLGLFKAIHGAKDAAARFLRQEESRQSLLRDALFSPSLRRAVREWQRFEKSGGLIRFAGFLEKEARQILNLDLADPANQKMFPQIARLLRLKRLEPALRPALVKNETRDLSAWLRKFPEGAALAARLEILFGDGPALSDPEDRPRCFLEELYRTMRPRGFSFRRYPNLSLFGEYRVLESEMDAAPLFAELARLNQELLSALARGARERELLRRTGNLSLLGKLFRLELTREDYEKISKEPAAYRPSDSGANFLFDRALDFYRLAERREEAFVQKALRRMEQEGKERAILVTGGFHAPGLSRAFRERGISYLSVRPRISGADAASGDKYLAAMLSHISKVLTTLPPDHFASRLARLTGDADYPRYSAGRILEEARRVSPVLSGARPESLEFLARAAGWHRPAARAAALGSEPEAVLKPINPLLGVRLAETFFILKDPVLMTAGQINPAFFRSETLFEFSPEVYERFLAALERQPGAEAQRIARGLRESPSGYQDLAEVFQARERGTVMYLFESAVLGLASAARRRLFAQAAFSFAANSLPDEREQFYATNFIAQVLQPSLRGGEPDMISVDELHSSLLEVLDLAGPFLLSRRILDPLRRSLDHMKAHWEGLFADIEKNYDRYYVEPVPAYLGVRLSPEVIVLHPEVHGALGKVFPGFARGAGPQAVTPQKFFEFLEAVRQAGTPAASRIYAAIDKTGHGRSRLSLLLGPSAEGYYFINEAELAAPESRTRAFQRASAEVARRPEDSPRIFEALRAAYERHIGPAGSSLGQSPDGDGLFQKIMDGRFEPLETAWENAGLPRWGLEPAGRNLIHLLGLPDKAGDDPVRTEIIRQFQASLVDGVWIADQPDGDSWQTHHEPGFGLFISRRLWDSWEDKRELAKRLALEAIRTAPPRWKLDLKRIAERAEDIPLESLAGASRPAPYYLTAAYRQMSFVVRRMAEDSGVPGDGVSDLLDLLEKAGTTRHLLDLFRTRLMEFEEAVEAAMNKDFHASGLKKEMGNSDEGFNFEGLMNRIREFAGRWGVIHHPEKRRSLRYLSDAFHVEKAFLQRWMDFVELYLNPEKDAILRERYIEANLAHEIKEMEEQYGVQKIPATAMRMMREGVEKSVPKDNTDSYFQIKLRRILDEEPAKILAGVEARYRHWVRNFFHPGPPKDWELQAQLETTVQIFAARSQALVRELRPLIKRIPVIEFIPEPEGMSLGALPDIIVESASAGVLAPVLRAFFMRLFEPGGELSGYDLREIRVKFGREEDPVYDPQTKKVTIHFRASADLYRSVTEIGKNVKRAVEMTRLRVVPAKEMSLGKTPAQLERVGKALKQLWLSDEWQGALPRLGDYQGLDLKTVRTFVIQKTDAARIPPPQAIPESNALRIFVNDKDEIGPLFISSLRAILNQPPLRIEMTEWSRYLEDLFPDAAERERIVERIRRTVSWEDFSPDVLSGTRAVLLRLERPVVYRGVTYHSIKIKGITFAGIFQPLKTPHHPGAQSTRVDESGKLVHEEDVNFQGGAPAAQTRHEFEGMARGYEDGITLDIPLGHGIYPDFEVRGERGGFIVSLIQGEQDLRMEDSFNAYLRELMPGEEIETAHFTRVFQEKGDIYGIRSHIDDFFRRAGRALRDAHDKGYFFMYPHFGNLTEFEGRFYWHDFDSWEDIRNLSAARQLGYRFFDLFQVFNHLEQFALFKPETFGLFSGLFGIRPIQAILEGYFYDWLGDGRVWETQDKDDLIRLRMRIAERPVQEIQHPVIQLLRDVVLHKKPPGPNVPPHIPAVYVYPKQDSNLDRLLHGVARDMVGHRNRWFQIFRRLGVRAISIAENYDERMIAEYWPERREIVVAVPRRTDPRRAAEMIEKSFQTLAVKVREERVLSFANSAAPEQLKALLGTVKALGPQAKGGETRVQAVVSKILKARPFASTLALRKVVQPRLVYDGFQDGILASSLGAAGEKPDGAAVTPEAEAVAREAAGNFIDSGLIETDEAAFDAIYSRLFPSSAARPVDPAVSAFNAGLAPALEYLGLRPHEKPAPLILEETVAGGPVSLGDRARKIIRTAGRGGAVILLWDHARHQGKKPSLRRYLDRLAARHGVQVRDFPLETVNGAALNQILKAYDLPALALASRPEPLALDFKGEKVRLDLKFFEEQGIDPLQALALFKQIVDNPPEKRRELFFRAGLDFDAAGGYWTVGGRFAEVFLEKAYAAEIARRRISEAA